MRSLFSLRHWWGIGGAFVIKKSRGLPRFQHPRVRTQVVERANHRVADAQLLTPTERLQLRGVEEDEGTVADPPAGAAGVVPLWGQTKPFGDPAERVVHFAVFIRAEVHHVHRVGRLLD